MAQDEEDFQVNSDLVKAIEKYLQQGFRLLFYEQKLKGPKGQDAANWNQRSDNLETLKNWKEAPNLGTFLGHEIQPGKFLADID